MLRLVPRRRTDPTFHCKRARDRVGQSSAQPGTSHSCTSRLRAELFRHSRLMCTAIHSLIEQAESCRREMRATEPLQGMIWQYFGAFRTQIVSSYRARFWHSRSEAARWRQRDKNPDEFDRQVNDRSIELETLRLRPTVHCARSLGFITHGHAPRAFTRIQWVTFLNRFQRSFLRLGFLCKFKTARALRQI